MAINEHVEIVLKGAESIEKWRSANPDSRLNLDKANLRRAKLEHSNLSNANMREADLEWADLRWADLVRAELTDAKLTRADFHKADLLESNLAGTMLKLTNFEDANLSNASFSSATFENTRLINTDLSGAKGLETCNHPKSSLIDNETISVSDNIPVDFLKGCGLSDREIRLSVKQLVSAEVFSDFLDQAEYLLSEGYKDAAAVMIGSVLEQHLRHLHSALHIDTPDFRRSRKAGLKKASKINDELKRSGVYNQIDHRHIQSWFDIRNRAAHGDYDQYSQIQVKNMLKGILEFIARVRQNVVAQEKF